jgi:hypothetical protein
MAQFGTEAKLFPLDIWNTTTQSVPASRAVVTLRRVIVGVISNVGASYHEFTNTANAIGLLVYNPSASLTANGCLFLEAARNTTNNTFYAISYYNTGATAYKFRVADSGNVTNTNNSYGSISDVKLKQDIVDAGSQWDDIKNLRVRKYRWKSDPDGFMQMGLVAQEAEEVSPGLVEEHPDYEEITRTREVEKTRVVTRRCWMRTATRSSLR